MENIVITMKDKKVIIQRTTFSLPPKSLLRESRIPNEIVHTTMIKELVYNALIAQSTQKSPRLDKINFGILRMI